jgi:hypothetical protein
MIRNSPACSRKLLSQLSSSSAKRKKRTVGFLMTCLGHSLLNFFFSCLHCRFSCALAITCCCSSCALVIVMGSSSTLGPIPVLRCPMLFNGTNYRDWVTQMCLHMRGLRLWEFLTLSAFSRGSCPTRDFREDYCC